uniref:Putative secreted protein n=1 Tax=Anopheles darlingi TaxID=43151 RepID=A0A2M4DAW9_ANODA
MFPIFHAASLSLSLSLSHFPPYSSTGMRLRKHFSAVDGVVWFDGWGGIGELWVWVSVPPRSSGKVQTCTLHNATRSSPPIWLRTTNVGGRSVCGGLIVAKASASAGFPRFLRPGPFTRSHQKKCLK